MRLISVGITVGTEEPAWPRPQVLRLVAVVQVSRVRTAISVPATVTARMEETAPSTEEISPSADAPPTSWVINANTECVRSRVRTAGRVFRTETELSSVSVLLDSSAEDVEWINVITATEEAASTLTLTSCAAVPMAGFSRAATRVTDTALTDSVLSVLLTCLSASVHLGGRGFSVKPTTPPPTPSPVTAQRPLSFP